MIFILILICAFVLYFLFMRLIRIPRVKGIHQKCVLITGCDSGFGNAFAKRLDSMGVPVFAACLTAKGQEDLKACCSERVKSFLLDLSRPSSVQEALIFVQTNISGNQELWGLVNNAGMVGCSHRVEFDERKDFERIFAVNIFGMVDMVNTFLPLLKRSKGRIVNTSSIAGLLGLTFHTAYTSSKHAVVGYTESIRRDVTIWGIKVSCIEPTLFTTALSNMDTQRSYLERKWQELTQATKEEFGEDYVGRAIAFLAKVYGTGSPDFSPVLDSYEEALFTVYPKSHYMCGSGSVLWSILIFYTPRWVLDLMMSVTHRLPLPCALLKRDRE